MRLMNRSIPLSRINSVPSLESFPVRAVLLLWLVLSVCGRAETVTIDLLPGEYWWGGTVGGGWRMPVGEKGREVKDLRVDSDGNQAAPLLPSTKGRWVWCEDAFKYTIAEGKLTQGELGI